MRRILLFLFIVALIGGGVWFFTAKQREQQSSTDTTPGFLSFLTPNTAKQSLGVDTPVPLPSPTTDRTDDSFDRLQQVTNTPVAGFVTYTSVTTVTKPATDPKQKPIKETVTEYILRYVSRNNGYVYEIKDEAAPIQISNIFIPNIYEAYFTDGGKTALLRFLRENNQTIATYAVPVPDLNPDNTRTQKEGTFLADNLASIAVSPDTKSVAQLLPATATATIATTDSKGVARKEILTSPYKSWLVQWPEKNIYVQTKALSDAGGFLYRINTTEKRLQKVVGDVRGLTTSVSPLGTYVLYSESSLNSFSTKLFNTKTGATKLLSALILPEKCVWLKNEDLLCAGNDAVTPAQYPDSWYAGVTSFSDKLYKVYTSAGILSVLDEGSARSYDAINLSINESQGLLYFIDKKTGYLWKFSL